MGNKDYDFIFHEYLVKYNIEVDYFNIQKKTRESYMYLEELKEIYFNSIEVETRTGSSNEIRRNFKRQILDLLEEFEELDRLPYDYFQESYIQDGKVKIRGHELKEGKLEDIINILSSFVKLKEKIDKLQLEILKHICDQYLIILQIITDNDNTGLDYVINLNEATMYKHFNIDTDLDRIDTIELGLAKGSKLDNMFNKKEKEILPYYLKVVNYDRLLERQRVLFKEYSKALIESMKLKAVQEEKEELQRYNRSIKILTALNVIVALIGIFGR